MRIGTRKNTSSQSPPGARRLQAVTPGRGCSQASRRSRTARTTPPPGSGSPPGSQATAAVSPRFQGSGLMSCPSLRTATVTSSAPGTRHDDVHRLTQIDHVADRAAERVLSGRDRVGPTDVHPLRTHRDAHRLAFPHGGVVRHAEVPAAVAGDEPLPVGSSVRLPIKEVRFSDELRHEGRARILVDLGRASRAGPPARCP